MEAEEERKQVYRVHGLTCTNCSAQFERNVKEIEGVVDARVNFGAAKLTVIGEASIQELEKAGAFEHLKIYPEAERDAAIRKPSFWQRKATVQTAVSFLFLVIGVIAAGTGSVHSAVPVLCYALSIAIGGYALFLKGLKNIIHVRFDMNTLMTVAIIGAALIGEWQEGAVVVFLFAISEALESYSMDKARQSVRSLMRIAPKEATVKRGEEELRIPVEDVRIGDMMVIKPGQKIAMDGVVVGGHSAVNQSAITGESMPVTKAAGDDVYAGTFNEEGMLEVRVTKHAEDTTIAKIVHLVEEAQSEKAPSQQFVEKFAKYYTPLIMLAAAGTMLIPPLFFHGDWSHWIYEGLAILVVGCPCALVVSTPVAIVTAIGNAARNGVLIKGGIHLEETGALRAVAFDKTGTMTKGIPEVTDVVALSGRDSRELLAIAAGIEKHSQHPLAGAILRKAESEHIDLRHWETADFRSVTGKGAQGTVHGTAYFIGTPRWFEEHNGGELPDSDRIHSLQQQGKTVMLLGTSRDVLALIAVADQVRENSGHVIEKLRKLGIVRTVLLTGDNRAAAERIAQLTGVDEVSAELMPQDKLEAVKQLQKEYGKAAMVGDGVNDAPALAAASVGIAMGGAGTDTALETADIALMGDDLNKLPYAIALSRKALQIIKMNVAFALGIKLAALLLVIPGWLTLWIAIISDMGATILVVLNSLRLLKVKE